MKLITFGTALLTGAAATVIAMAPVAGAQPNVPCDDPGGASRGAAFSNTTRSPTMLFPVLKHSPTLSSVFRHSHTLSSVNTHNTSHDVHCLCR